MQESSGPAFAASVGPLSSCQGEAVLVAPGKPTGTERIFFAVPFISNTIASAPNDRLRERINDTPIGEEIETAFDLTEEFIAPTEGWPGRRPE